MKIATALAISLFFSSCSNLNYDLDVSLNEVDLGTQIFGPKVTLEDLQDKIAKKHGYKVIRHVHQLFVKPIK